MNDLDQKTKELEQLAQEGNTYNEDLSRFNQRLYDPRMVGQAEEARDADYTRELLDDYYKEVVENQPYVEEAPQPEEPVMDEPAQDMIREETPYGTIELTREENETLMRSYDTEVVRDIKHARVTIEEQEEFSQAIKEAREWGEHAYVWEKDQNKMLISEEQAKEICGGEITDDRMQQAVLRKLTEQERERLCLDENTAKQLINDFVQVSDLEDPKTAHDTRKALIDNVKDELKKAKDFNNNHTFTWQQARNKSHDILCRGEMINIKEGKDERARLKANKTKSMGGKTAIGKGAIGLGKNMARFEKDPAAAVFGSMENVLQIGGGVSKLIQKHKEKLEAALNQSAGLVEVKGRAVKDLTLNEKDLQAAKSQLNHALDNLEKAAVKSGKEISIELGSPGSDAVTKITASIEKTGTSGRNQVQFRLDGEAMSKAEICDELEARTRDLFDEKGLESVGGKESVTKGTQGLSAEKATAIESRAGQRAADRAVQRAAQKGGEKAAKATKKAVEKTAKTAMKGMAKTNWVTMAAEKAISTGKKMIELSKGTAKEAVTR